MSPAHRKRPSGRVKELTERTRREGRELSRRRRTEARRLGPVYEGSVGATAPAPLVATKTAGSAHVWVLIPVAIAAVVLIIGAFAGDRRLGGTVALCGLLGLAVALAIYLPQGLDAGRAGLAFSGSEAELLQGFWAEVACSAVLVLCGGLLAHYSRGMAPARRGRSDRVAARDRVSREDGGISPGLQTES